MEKGEEKGKIISFGIRDEFSKFEEDFKDPQIESEIEALRKDERFKKRLVSGIMSAIQKEERFTNAREPISINRGKTQREKWEEEKRRRDALSAVENLPDNVVPFRRK